jgi:hypothetical protein
MNSVSISLSVNDLEIEYEFPHLSALSFLWYIGYMAQVWAEINASGAGITQWYSAGLLVG